MLRLSINQVNVEDIEISLDVSDNLSEIYEELSSDDKEVLIEWLKEDCMIPEIPKWLWQYEGNLRDQVFARSLEALAKNRMQMSVGEEHQIIELAKKFLP